MAFEGRMEKLLKSIVGPVDELYNVEWPGILKVIYAAVVVLPVAVLVVLLSSAGGLVMLLAWAFLSRENYREYIVCQN